MATYTKGDKLRFLEDPGHGWLEVPMSLLLELKIAGQISQYSYRKGDTAYLEEDCDAPILIAAAKEQDMPINFDEQHSDEESWVRNLPSYHC